MFINWFKKNGRVAGTTMSKEAVLKNIIKNLDKKQDDLLEKAMRELTKSGFMTVGEDGYALILTQKGADLL